MMTQPGEETTTIGHAGLEEVVSYVNGGQFTEGDFDVSNAALGQALVAFEFQIKVHANSAWSTLLAAAEFGGVPTNLMPWLTGDPTALAAGASEQFRVAFGAVYAWRIMANAAALTTDVTVRYNLW